MGLAVGGVMVTAILQIVRAKWSPALRRLAEANVSFLPYAYLLLLFSYFGSYYLFPWGRAPMPGREWWMQPEFVYARFTVLFAGLYWLMCRYVGWSLRSDIGYLREHKYGGEQAWKGVNYLRLTRNWKGAAVEVPDLQRKMSTTAPLIVALYAIIYSLFAFEMIMGIDTIWYSNLYGGFTFIGNIFIGWASLALLTIFYDLYSKPYSKVTSTGQLWDLAKLNFGFTMLWGYLFFSQFLPQWYGNLPEETQWLILRTREMPWKAFAYVVFSMCFVIPFITLMSRDLKRTPFGYAVVAIIILLGVWGEKYVTIMPSFSPDTIPLLHSSFVGPGVVEVALFLGFMAAYLLCITGFMSRYPYIPVSHPQTRGSVDW
jgi:hypothetical protein